MIIGVPIDTVKSRGDIVNDIESFVIYILERADATCPNHDVQLTFDHEGAVQLSSSLVQILSLVKNQKTFS